MRKILFFKRIKENAGASRVNLACVFMIVLLMGACASEYKKQISFEIPPAPSPGEVSVTYADETGQVSAKGESVNGETNDDQEIVCRTIKGTGSRIGRKKICATKAEWALWARAQREEADKTIRDIVETSNVNTGSGIDAMGGQSSGPAH